jgi:hypothetical protein
MDQADDLGEGRPRARQPSPNAWPMDQAEDLDDGVANAMQPLWPTMGELACAASPIRRTRSRRHSGRWSSTALQWIWSSFSNSQEMFELNGEMTRSACET